MEDEAMVCAEVDVRSLAYGISTSDMVMDVRSYLSRPHSRLRGTISSGAGNLFSINYNNLSAFQDHVGSIAWDRLRGSAGIRATLVFRVVATATPFHQGVLALAWQYTAIPSGTAPDLNRGLFPALTTNLPHVKLDLAENTAAELRVPFVFQYEYIPVASHVFDGTGSNYAYGSFYVTKLTDVRVIAGQTAPSYTLYTSLEDIEVIGACPINVTSVQLQAGTEPEREAKRAGIVSGILDSASGVANALGRIPNLRKLGANTAWFLKASAGVAAAFGYSKPADTSNFQRVVNNDYRGESQVDMPSAALLAGPFQSNTLVTDGTVGCDSEDHMAFDKILSVPSYIYRKTWSGTAVASDFLYGAVISPSCFWYREGGLGNIPLPGTATLSTSAFLPSTLMYIGSNFRYWRGDLKFTFHFSKTKLHGGRILISYTPDWTLSPAVAGATTVNVTDASGGADMDSYSKLFDLKDGSVVDFVVPYMAVEPYTNFNARTGALSVNVVSPLNSPGNASDSIDMMVFVEAMPGFEFAGLCPSTLEAHNPRSNHLTAGVYLQAGGVTNTLDASQRAIGEVFKSVKQIAMIPDWHVADATTATQQEITLAPWFRKNYVNSVSGTVTLPDSSQAVYYGSKCGRMAEMFCFVNGSTDYTLVTDSPDDPLVTVSVTTAANDGNVTVANVASIYNKKGVRSAGFYMLENRGSFRVRVPTYSNLFRIPFARAQFEMGNYQTTALTQLTYSGVLTSQMTNLLLRNNKASSIRFALGRAAGEDATMAHFIGPPVCCFWQSTKTTSPNPSPDNF